MKIGTIVGGKKVEDVKLIRHNNLIQVFRQVSELQEEGYKVNLNSVRDNGIIKQLYMFKTEEQPVKTTTKANASASEANTGVSEAPKQAAEQQKEESGSNVAETAKKPTAKRTASKTATQ